MVDISKLFPGMEVIIEDDLRSRKVSRESLCGISQQMLKYEGKLVHVERVFKDRPQYIRISEDFGRWSWEPCMIKSIVEIEEGEEFDMASDEDFSNLFGGSV